MPLEPYRDGVRPSDFHLIYALMHYPNDLLAAMDYATAVFRWESDPSRKAETPLSRTLEMFQADMNRRYGRASMSGLILAEFAQLRQDNAVKASARKAAYIAAQLASDQPTNGRKKANFPSDEKDIQRHFREFRSVSHLWLAFMATGSKRGELAYDQSEYSRFLFAAHHFSVEFVFMKTKAHEAAREAPFFWEPPLVNLAGEVKVSLDEDTLRLSNAYRHLEDRD